MVTGTPASSELAVSHGSSSAEQIDPLQTAEMLIESLREAAAQGRLQPHLGWSLHEAGLRPHQTAQVFEICGAPSPSFIVVDRPKDTNSANLGIRLCHVEQGVLTPPGRTTFMGMAAPCQLRIVDVLVSDLSFQSREPSDLESADEVLLIDHGYTASNHGQNAPVHIPGMTRDALHQFAEEITTPVAKAQNAQVV